MAYRKHTFTFTNSIEHAYKFAGHTGAKGEHRAKKEETDTGTGEAAESDQ